MKDIINFMWAKHIMGPFDGYFEEFNNFPIAKFSRAYQGAFSRWKKSRAPQNTPQTPPYMF